MNDDVPITVWVLLLVHVAIGLGLVGVGATVARKAHAAAGYLLIGAGALEVVLTCCTRGLSMLARSQDVLALFTVVGVTGYARLFLVVLLVVIALVMLANKLKAQPPRPPRQGAADTSRTA